MTAALQGALEGRVRYRDWDFRLQPRDFSAFLDERRRGFVGRAWLFQELQQWLDQGGGLDLLVTGDPGIGKSAIVAELIHRNPPQLLAFHCCLSDTQVFAGEMLIALDRRLDYGETRFVGFGPLKGRVTAIVFSRRMPDIFRIISLGKAIRREQRRYEKAIADRLGQN